MLCRRASKGTRRHLIIRLNFESVRPLEYYRRRFFADGPAPSEAL